MTNAVPLDAAGAARVPREGLVALAPLRRLRGIQVSDEGDSAWVVWDGEMPALVLALLAVPGVVFYVRRDLDWLPLGTSLPDFTAPSSVNANPVDRAIVPGAVTPAPVPEWAGNRISVTLAASLHPQPTTALRCRADVFLRWSARAEDKEIEQLSGAVCGQRIWLRGKPPPALAGSERFWGERVLTPLGLRPEPNWPEASLREAAHVDDDEILVLTPDGPEALPAGAFRQLNRERVKELGKSLAPPS